MTTLAGLTKLIGVRFGGGAGGPSARFGNLALGYARLDDDSDNDADYTYEGTYDIQGQGHLWGTE